MDGPAGDHDRPAPATLPRGAGELGRALSLSTVSRAGAMATSLAINALLARALTQSEFAFFGVLISFSSAFVIFLQLGYQTGITKIAGEASHAGDQTALGEAFWASTLAVVTLGAVALPVMVLLREALFPPVNGGPASPAIVAIVAAYCVTLALANTFAEGIRGLGHVGAASSLTGMGQHGGVVRGAAILLVAAPLALFGSLSLAAALVIATLASLVTCVWALVIAGRTETLASGPRAIAASFRRHLPMNLQLMAGQGLQVMASQHATLIVGGMILSGPPLAMIVAAQQIRNILTAPLTLFNGAAPKLMIHAYQDGNRDELEQIVRLGASFATAVVLLIAPLFLLFGRPIFTILFGASYADGAFYFSLLIPGLIAFAMGGSAGRMMALLGRQKAFMVYSACIAAISLPLLAWSAQTYGATGISIATSALLITQNLVLVLLVRHYFGVWSHAYMTPRRYVALAAGARAMIGRRLARRR